MRLTLRTKILLLIAGTVTGLLSVLLVGLALFTEREIGHATRQDVQTTSRVLAQFLREQSQAQTDMALLLAQQPALKQYLLGREVDSQTRADSLREYLRQMHADAAALTDDSGRWLGATDREIKTSGPAQEPGIEAALRGENWSGVVARDGRLTLAVSVPVLEPVSKYVKGTFTTYIAIDTKVALTLKRALGSEVAFVHRGQVVGASLPVPQRLPTPKNAPGVVTLDHTAYFALYAPLPGTDPQAGIGLVTLRPCGPAWALHARFRAVFIGVSGGMLALALAAGAMVARSITRPLDSLVAAAQTVQSGAWPERFSVRRSDEIGLLQLVFNEMTDAIRASQERLLALIDTDPLTGLDNHRRFQERLAQEAKRGSLSGEALSLLLFDLDHFQKFNQRLGHAEGDAALRKVARILRDCLPEVAILARYGGEEFAALLPRHSFAQAETCAEAIRERIEAAGMGRESGQRLTVSVGCAEFGTHTTQAEGLVVAVELAAIRAKQLGRNRVCRFDSVPGADETADPYQLHRFVKEGSLATIQALAAAVDAKDSYTQGHSRRVAEYASALARSLGLPANEVELIYTTGTLHDVGKIGVPDAILKKPGRLEPEERAIMETHPVLGEVIICKAPQLAATLPGVRHHHEAWNGSGYPDRLAGETIPYIARILAIADTYDAMTSDRPYRKGLPHEVALAEIARGAGTQFDPALAAAFVTLMREIHALPRAA